LDLPEPDERFQTNLAYPDHPECDWTLLTGEPLDEELIGTIPYEVVPIYVPVGGGEQGER
jgi:hypothetical protein